MTEHEELTYCVVHPEREALLRCNKCDRYMCVACAVQTPVGYRCRECVRQQDDRFFNAHANDPLIVLAVCAGAGVLAGGVVSMLGWILIALLLGFPVGTAIGQAARRAIAFRKGRNTPQMGAAGMVIGGLAGAAARAYLTYPDEYREMYRQFDAAGMRVPKEISAVVPSLSAYVIDHMLALGVLLFVGLAAYAVYARIKI